MRFYRTTIPTSLPAGWRVSLDVRQLADRAHLVRVLEATGDGRTLVEPFDRLPLKAGEIVGLDALPPTDSPAKPVPVLRPLDGWPGLFECLRGIELAAGTELRLDARQIAMRPTSVITLDAPGERTRVRALRAIHFKAGEIIGLAGPIDDPAPLAPLAIFVAVTPAEPEAEAAAARPRKNRDANTAAAPPAAEPAAAGGP